MNDDVGPTYRQLSAMYGWTPKEISRMTYNQQMMYIESEAESGTRTFPTIGEARAEVNRLKGI